MKTRYIISLLIVVACGLGVWRWKTMPPPEAKPVVVLTLVQEWTPNSNYAGAVFGRKEFAARQEVELQIRPGSETIDPIKLVIAGGAQFGDAAADKVVAAIAQGADLVVIGVLNNDSPTCFLAKQEKGIRTPFDFVGKNVGVLTGTSTEYVYRAMLDKLQIDKSKFTEVEVPFDLATFASGAYDVRPAFIYDEPVSLDLLKIKYDVIDPRGYGIGFLGTVYFTTSKMVRQHPELVQKFVNVVADGWRATLSHPDTALQYLVEAYPNDIQLSRERLALEKSLPYFRGYGGKPLTLDPVAWDQMIASLHKLGVLSAGKKPSAPSLDFVAEYYNKPSSR